MDTNKNAMLNELSEEFAEEIKAAKRAYDKHWRDNNKDKVKAKNQRYWLKRAMALRAEKEREQNDN